MRRLPLLAALIVLAALAPAAQAATVNATDDGCAAPPCVANLEVKAAAAGERNDLSLEPDGGGIVIRDAATPLVAGRNCVRRDDGSVRCELARPITQVQIQTGDGDSVVRAMLPAANLVTVIFGRGNDRFEAAAKEVWANGLDGDDTLIALGGKADFEGRAGADVLAGGPAGDELSGGPGRDRVSGGDGDDVLFGRDGDFDGIDDDEVAAGDELDGGPGRDTASYAFRDFAVRVDLADPAPDGAPGEGDVLRGIEDLRGGEGGDRLYGDGGPNRLLGEDGEDELRGRGGDDFLALGTRGAAPFGERADGGAGDDDVRAGSGGTVLGGSGDDVLRGARDTRAVCGTGRDVLRPRPGQSMGMASDCERWAIRFGGADDLVVATPPRRTGREVGVSVGCPTGPTCTFVLTVATTSGRRVGRDSIRVRSGSRGVVDVRVPSALARSRLRVFVRVSDGDGYALGGGVIATPR
jgi:Ca2+-binding RTX toxin-like protein